MTYFALVSRPITYIVVGLVGATVGSLLNIVIHRLPECGAAIAFHRKMPLLRYFSPSRHCQEDQVHISITYPVVEALTAILFIVVAWHDGLTLVLPFDLIFVAAITALIFIDAGHMILPDAITYPGLLFAVVARLAIPYLLGQPHFDDLEWLLGGPLAGMPLWAASLVGAFLAALMGGGSLWFMGWLWERLRGKEAMGLGDVKMMFMVGAYLGWRLTILTIFLGTLLGSIVGVALSLHQRKGHLQSLVPFGVFLGIGAIFALIFGTQIVTWYVSFYR